MSKTTEAVDEASLNPDLMPEEIKNAFIHMYEEDGKHKWGSEKDAEHCAERLSWFLAGAVTAAEFEHRHDADQ